MPYFCGKLGKMSQNLSSAAVVIGALRVKGCTSFKFFFNKVAESVENLPTLSLTKLYLFLFE